MPPDLQQIISDVFSGAIDFLDIFGYIGTLFLPKVDYWAKRTITEAAANDVNVKNSFYSIRLDENRDGYAESQVMHEKTETSIFTKFERTDCNLFTSSRTSLFGSDFN